MLYCELIDSKGHVLPLTQEDGYAVYEVQGINPVPSSISKSSKFSLDGSVITNARVEERNINLLMYLEGDPEPARLALYHFMRPSDNITLHFVGETRDVKIDGVVEDIQVEYHSFPQKVEITIVCPHPYFRDSYEYHDILGKTTGLLEFPFFNNVGTTFELGRISNDDSLTIIYDGDVDTGLTIELVCHQIAKNPKIRNDTTGEFLGLNVDLQAGDVIKIVTINGQKKILLTTENGTRNIFNAKTKHSSWFKLRRGENKFSLDAEMGLAGIRMTVNYSSEYIGV